MGIDWEKGDILIRAGILSLREIARQLNCSDGTVRAHIKSKGLERDLSARVKERVRTKLLRTESRTPNVSDDEIVEGAANVGVQVKQTHRRDIKLFRETALDLLEELRRLSENREELDELARDIATFKAQDLDEQVDIDAIQKKYVAILKATSLPEKAKIMQALCNCLSRLVPLELGAYSLDDDTQGNVNLYFSKEDKGCL